MRRKTPVRERIDKLGVGKTMRVAGVLPNSREYFRANNYVQRIRRESAGATTFSLTQKPKSLSIKRLS